MLTAWWHHGCARLARRMFRAALLVPAVSFAGSPVDVLAQWQQARVASLGARNAHAHTTADLIGQVLVDPSSPYSDAIAAPFFTNDVEWPGFVEGLPGGRWTTATALAGLQRSLGATRARPGIDVEVPAGTRHPFTAAGMIKAAVDPQIFWHLLEVMGYRHPAEAAVYAVGLDVLKHQMEAMPDPRQRERASVDPDVYDRVMRARTAADLQPYDTRYLTTLVQARLVHWVGGREGSGGDSPLPMAYRVARVAAAYRDREGYVTGSPCLPDGSPREGVAGTGLPGDARPLCFVAATDRAVHRWVISEARRHASPASRSHHTSMATIGTLAALLPLLDIVAALEFVEATIADDLYAGGSIDATDAELASERADTLSCRIVL